ncbi:MAG: alpha/beta hydrolase [Bullifex sp.]
MAYIRMDVKSDVMDMYTSVMVMLPDDAELGNVPVVYLLHGLSDNATMWSRFTAAERYGVEHEVAIVMPEVQRSFYADMKYGLNYFTFITDELPSMMEKYFRLSNSKMYVMGLSMGGYGALKCALTYPMRYKGAAAFSCVSDLESLLSSSPESRQKEAYAIFGEDFPEDANLFALLSDKEELPPFYITCGDDDRLFPHSVMIRDALIAKGADVTWEHWKGGHEWAFWDRSLCRAFELFFS